MERDELTLEPVREATERVANAEHELTLALGATSLPERDADNVIVGDRLRHALSELGLARRALQHVLDGIQ